MITRDEAAKRLEGETIEFIPSDLKRIVIPAYGFVGATDQKRQEWGADGSSYMEDVKGFAFVNAKDQVKGETKPNQVLKQNDGVLLIYDGPGRLAKVSKYLSENPNAVKDVIHLKKLIKFLSELTADGGKPDVWEADVNFAAGLKDAPAREDIKPGKVFAAAKQKEIDGSKGKAFYVSEGEKLEKGATGEDQEAHEGGAYIVKDKDGMRLVQADAFKKAYIITKMPKTMGRDYVKE
ncbi:MAG: hypothetical protein IJ218_04340 [Alphaproteobacteria bacterium]|nr:hypothetical protein [Alphaproteobacteria bacterium]